MQQLWLEYYQKKKELYITVDKKRQELIDRLKRNGIQVNIDAKTIVVGSQEPGLKVLAAIDGLIKYYKFHKL